MKKNIIIITIAGGIAGGLVGSFFGISGMGAAIAGTIPAATIGAILSYLFATRNKLVVLLPILIFLSSQSYAQSWEEQQRIYNEKSRLETELFQQKEEYERLEREQKNCVNPLKIKKERVKENAIVL